MVKADKGWLCPRKLSAISRQRSARARILAPLGFPQLKADADDATQQRFTSRHLCRTIRASVRRASSYRCRSMRGTASYMPAYGSSRLLRRDRTAPLAHARCATRAEYNSARRRGPSRVRTLGALGPVSCLPTRVDVEWWRDRAPAGGRSRRARQGPIAPAPVPSAASILQDGQGCCTIAPPGTTALRNTCRRRSCPTGTWTYRYTHHRSECASGSAWRWR